MNKIILSVFIAIAVTMAEGAAGPGAESWRAAMIGGKLARAAAAQELEARLEAAVTELGANANGPARGCLEAARGQAWAVINRVITEQTVSIGSSGTSITPELAQAAISPAISQGLQAVRDNLRNCLAAVAAAQQQA